MAARLIDKMSPESNERKVDEMVFQKFEKKHGPAKSCQSVTPQDLETYKGKLPDDLLSLWKESGWCSYADGLLWTINPAEYSAIVKEWIGDDSLLAFVRTAFGSLLLWNGEQARFLDVLSGDVSNLFTTMDFNFNGSLSDDKYLDAVIRRDVFVEALPRLGPPARDECYAFVPALPLGGPGTADTLQKVKLREHMSLLLQLIKSGE